MTDVDRLIKVKVYSICIDENYQVMDLLRRAQQILEFGLNNDQVKSKILEDLIQQLKDDNGKLISVKQDLERMRI